MYAKVHKNGNITVYRDDLDCRYRQFDCKGKGAIDCYSEFVTNIYYVDSINAIDVQTIDGRDYYVFTADGRAIEVSKEQYDEYDRRGIVTLRACDAKSLLSYDIDIYNEIYSF